MEITNFDKFFEKISHRGTEFTEGTGGKQCMKPLRGWSLIIGISGNFPSGLDNLPDKWIVIIYFR